MKIFGKNKETSPQAEMDERIAQFLRGQLSQADADAFRAEMKENARLRERAILVARMIKQMREVGEERRQRVVDAMQMTDRRTIEQIARGKGEKLLKPRKSLTRRLAPWIAAAAVLCCVVLVGRAYWTKDVERQVINYANNHLSVRLEKNSSVQVKQLPKNVVSSQHSKLEELALLRGKVEMGMDLEDTTKRLQAIYKKAKQSKDSLYAPFATDIAFALAEAYHKLGDQDAEAQILDELSKPSDGTEMTSQ